MIAAEAPVVFWAVSAVIALIPYTPLSIIVFKSADDIEKAAEELKEAVKKVL